MAESPIRIEHLLVFAGDEEAAYYKSPERTEAERNEIRTELEEVYHNIPDPTDAELKQFMGERNWQETERNPSTRDLSRAQWKSFRKAAARAELEKDKVKARQKNFYDQATKIGEEMFRSEKPTPKPETLADAPPLSAAQATIDAAASELREHVDRQLEGVVNREVAGSAFGQPSKPEITGKPTLPAPDPEAVKKKKESVWSQFPPPPTERSAMPVDLEREILGDPKLRTPKASRRQLTGFEILGLIVAIAIPVVGFILSAPSAAGVTGVFEAREMLIAAWILTVIGAFAVEFFSERSWKRIGTTTLLSGFLMAACLLFIDHRISEKKRQQDEKARAESTTTPSQTKTEFAPLPLPSPSVSPKSAIPRKRTKSEQERRDERARKALNLRDED